MKNDRIVIETERLWLRELGEEDALFFYQLNSDPEVIRYTGDRSFVDVEQARLFLSTYVANNYRKYNCGRWAVLLKEDNSWLGWCGIKYDPEEKEYDLGYRFFKKYWGQGYATESAIACLEYGLQVLGIQKIVGRALKENIASIVVLQKTGMILEKEFLMDDEFPAVKYFTLRDK